MATIDDIAKFRYETTADLVGLQGHFYLCNPQLNELLRDKENLPAKAPVFYAVLMHKKGVDAQRNIFFRYDIAKVIYYMQALTDTPEADGAFQYSILFFPNAKFIIVDDGYPALDDWLTDPNKKPKLSIKPFENELNNYLNDGSKFQSTTNHTEKHFVIKK